MTNITKDQTADELGQDFQTWMSKLSHHVQNNLLSISI